MTSPVILIVEDDPIVREYAAMVFADDLQCETLQVANAEQAIQALDNHPEITTAFIDVLMRGNLDGIGLATVLNISYPHIHVILTSGALPERIEHFDFIVKPWDVAELRRLVGGSAPGANDPQIPPKQRVLTLLAEDSATFRFLAEQTLVDAGHHVRSAVNGKEALALLAASMPYLLVTDLEMPEIDGGELIRAVLRQSPLLPVVILSSSAISPRLIMDEHPNAAICFVPKSSLSEQLLSAIAGLLSTRQARKALIGGGATPAA